MAENPTAGNNWGEAPAGWASAAMSSPAQSRRLGHQPHSMGERAASQSSLEEVAHGREKMPLRALPCSMQEKRLVRQQRTAQEEGDLPCWASWRQGQRKSQQRFRQGVRSLAGICQLWKAALNEIEGRFGTGIQSYFTFLRFLVCLNLLALLLTVGSVLLPVTVLREAAALPGGQDAEPVCLNYSIRTSLGAAWQPLHDIFTGKGFLESSYLFYGSYRVGQESSSHYSVRVAYLLSTLGYLLLCFLCILKRMASGVVERLVLSQEYSSRWRARIFAEWDFCIRSVAAASIKQQSICNSLKIDIAEKMRCLKNRQQSTRQRALLYLLRLLINSSILLLLAGAFYCIQQVTELSLDAEQKRTSPSMVLRYLPPVIIFLINVLLPYAFQALVKLEGWSPNTEINLTLIRCVMLKMASLGMFLFSLGQRILCVGDRGERMCQPCGYNKLYQCWETAIGQEMYKLTIFSFLTTIGVTFLISLPRRLIAEHASGRLARWVKKDEFLVPQNVLDIVAAQTVIWLGIFYSPLLPLLNTIFIFITFYIKKYTLYRDCRPSQRLFRASSSTFLFQLVLLLGLTMASASLGYVITRVPSSRACGLFANYTAAWKVVPEAVSTRLPPAAQRVLHYVASDAFCFPLLILLCLILTGIVSQTQANRRAIERLKKQQVLHVKEKWCLVRELATLLLEPRQPPVARSQEVLLSAAETSSRAQGMQETET